MPRQRRLSLWLLVSTALAFGCARRIDATADPNPAEARQEVLEVLHARLDAVVAGDVATLDAMLAPEFRYIDIWGTVQQRAEYLEGKRTSMNTDTDYWIGQTIEDAQVDFIQPNVATATLRVLDHFVYQGVEHHNLVRSSYVLRRVDGRWLVSLGHTTTIAPEEE